MRLVTIEDIDQFVDYTNSNLDDYYLWVRDNQVELFQNFRAADAVLRKHGCPSVGNDQNEFLIYCAFCYESEKMRRMLLERPTLLQ